ncbi:MAG TPA: hypothetical protein VFA00_10580, partial [Actinomycetota bacterium]|nr:hypothetical protein [Actinomycetota bacterium]
MRKIRLSALLMAFAMLVALGVPASAHHENDPRTKNLHPMGHIEEPASLFFGPPTVHTDIAFWGKYAIQGNWLGFNIRDISAPGNPKPVSFTSCEGNQGDVVVWENIVVRSWNSPAPADDPATPEDETAMCDGEPVPAGFEGLHVFDISDVNDPVLVGSVETECGSHTASGVPDLDNGRLLVYNTPSSGACPGIDIVEVPLDAPENAAYVRFEAAERPCHDTGVILGDAMTAACAGGNGFTVWDLDAANLEDPEFRYSKDVNDEPEISNVTIGHSAGFSFDGEVLIFGHEPGGGVAPNCQESTPDTDKSAFFFDAETGDLLGLWTIPRPQSATENCTVHNYNFVPLRSGRDVMVVGNYQAGTWVVDFTDPANPEAIAWSDPPPVVPTDLAGVWSSYWYNNFIYETNITEGLNIFRLSGKTAAGALKLGH